MREKREGRGNRVRGEDDVKEKGTREQSEKRGRGKRERGARTR